MERTERSRGRLIAIGDIHGCADEVGVLLDAIAPSAGDKLVFLGDYVDRGASPRAVIERLIELRDSRVCDTVFLRGNHEDMMLAYLGEPGRHGEAFLFNGGRATLASYSVSPTIRGDAARALIPARHLEFFRALELKHVEGSVLFVHAGIAPLRALDQQDEEDLLWIREEFIRNPHPLPLTVVFGHTPQREVFWHLPYKIGLDTGCVYGNKLSCLDFTSETLLQVERDSCHVTRRDVSDRLAPLKAHRTGV